MKMQVIRGSGRVVLVFDNFVIKLPRLMNSFRVAHLGVRSNYRLSGHSELKRIIEQFVRRVFYPIKNNLSEFVFYQKTHHSFCAKTFFSFFGLLNIQERVIHLKGTDLNDIYHFPRKKEYDLILDDVFVGRKEDVESHTFHNPVNFGFSKKRKVFVCLDYEDTMVQGNILEFGEKLQNAFKDFDKIKPLD